MADAIASIIGTLRELAADHAGWTTVCALLDRLSDDDVATHADGLDGVLTAWSASHRIAAPRWVKRLMRDGREPRVRLCREVALSGVTASAPLLRAIASEDIAAIARLRLTGCNIGPALTTRIAERLRPTRVAELDVSGDPIGVGIAAFLKPRDAESPSFALLSAESAEIGDDALAALAAERVTVGVRGLALGINYLTATGVGTLMALSGIENVERLSLSGNKFLATGVEELSRATRARFRQLDLGFSQCGDRGARLLASSAAFECLETLTLASCSIGDEGAEALATSRSLHHLHSLDLQYNQISVDGAASLLGSTSLRALRRLRLDGNPLGDELANRIASCPEAARLEYLLLDAESIGESTREALSRAPHLRNVTIHFE